MRILFLSQVFPDDRARVRGTFNLALCQALSEEHKVRIFSPRPWTEVLQRRLKGHGPVSSGDILEHTTLTAAYPTYWYVPRVALHRSANAILRAVRRPGREMLNEFRPDVVLSYWAHPEGRVGLEVAQQLGVPSACIIGGSDVLILPKRNRKRRQEIVRVLQESDAVITVSEGLRHACIELGAPPAQVTTIHQGIDRAHFYARDRVECRRKLRIPTGVTAYLWVGRLVGLKRLDVALEALINLHRSGKRVKLYVLGDGPDRFSAREYADTLGLGSAVDFVGPVNHDELPDWYSAADATVLSSDSEGLPNVLRESVACGTPFVATDVGSVTEFASPDYSIVVPRRDPNAMSEAMSAILEPDFRIAAGLHRPRTWQDCARQTANLLQPLTRNRPLPTTGKGDELRPPSKARASQVRSAAAAAEGNRCPTPGTLSASGVSDVTTREDVADDFLDVLNLRASGAFTIPRSEG